MQLLESLVVRLGTAGELVKFFLENKWWWLVPALVVLLLFVALALLAQTSPLAPFIYTLF